MPTLHIGLPVSELFGRQVKGFTFIVMGDKEAKPTLPLFVIFGTSPPPNMTPLWMDR